MVTVYEGSERDRLRRLAHAIDSVGTGQTLENAVKGHRRAEDDEQQDNRSEPPFVVYKCETGRKKGDIDHEFCDKKPGRIRVERKGTREAYAKAFDSAAERQELNQSEH